MKDCRHFCLVCLERRATWPSAGPGAIDKFGRRLEKISAVKLPQPKADDLAKRAAFPRPNPARAVGDLHCRHCLIPA
jgi:hypothetical protein